MRPILLLLLLAAPALAQDPNALARELEACTAGVDLEAVGTRAGAYAAAEDYEARVAALCTAGDTAGAIALAREVQADFYAQDAEAAGIFACLSDVLGPEALDPGDPCVQ
jgi:hypothetical protein